MGQTRTEIVGFSKNFEIGLFQIFTCNSFTIFNSLDDAAFQVLAVTEILFKLPKFKINRYK
jgi:hypothetical protein